MSVLVSIMYEKQGLCKPLSFLSEFDLEHGRYCYTNSVDEHCPAQGRHSVGIV